MPEMHGLYYISRDGRTKYQLDLNSFPQVDRPEREVLSALLRYALDGLEAQQYVLPMALQPQAMKVSP
jgi:hypothetical protein